MEFVSISLQELVTLRADFKAVAAALHDLEGNLVQVLPGMIHVADNARKALARDGVQALLEGVKDG